MPFGVIRVFYLPLFYSKVECRMDFGRPLDPAATKEKDVTRGKPRVDTPYLEVDDNGMLKYVARRNHPRLVASALQFPYCSTVPLL